MGPIRLGKRLWVTLLHATPFRTWTVMVRAAAGVPVPAALRKPVLGWIGARLGIDFSEAELSLDRYSSVAELFVRRLKSGARPLPPDPMAICCPVDGGFVNSGVIEDGKLLQAKGITYNLAELIGDEALAERFRGGTFVTLYLRPKDYHRVHCPLAAQLQATRRIAGRLFPVKPAVVRSIKGLFVANERLVFDLRSEGGRVLVVMVGAAGVGSMTTPFDSAAGSRSAYGLQQHEPALKLERGQELGAFNLGSTVIAIFQRGRVDLASFEEGAEVRVGRVLGHLARASLRVA